MITRKCFYDLAEILLTTNAKRAVKYFSDKEIVRATFRGSRRKNSRTKEILFTIGRPNYIERKFIALCKKAGEPIPVKKIQLQYSRITDRD